MADSVERGDVVDVLLPEPAGIVTAVVVSRSVTIAHREAISVAVVRPTGRGVPTEVTLGDEIDGGGVICADALATVPLQRLRRRRGQLPPARVAELDQALRLSLGL